MMSEILRSAAGADYSDCLAVKFHAAKPLGRPLAAARGEAMTQLAHHPENEGEGVLGHRGGAVVGHAGQGNTPLLGRGKVEMVRRGGTGGDQFDLRMTAEERVVHARIDENRHDLGVSRDFREGVDKADLVLGEAVDEERLLVILGLDKNNFHGRRTAKCL